MSRVSFPDDAQPSINERRVIVSLTDDEIEYIAEKAAEKAVAKMTSMVYQEVGKGVVNKLFWIVGLSAIGIYIYLQQRGIIK